VTRKDTIKITPSGGLANNFRNLGYSFSQAVADIIDNSIEFNASRVFVDMVFDGKDSWIRIADNGKGMTSKEITEAMKYGSERNHSPDELSIFGLGLKLASTSQCRRFTVASRVDPGRRRLEALQFDIDYIAKHDWDIKIIHPDKRSDKLVEPLNDTVGTVVLWEVLDRLLKYKIPGGEKARAGYYKLADELDQHLGMVFHRFLSGQVKRRRKLKITVNGTEVRPWDPFARDEKATVKLEDHQFEVKGEDGMGLVTYSPYILPSKQQFSSLVAFNRYAGPAKWNAQQGFYIYRSDRMIQSGGWNRMIAPDEHTKYARAAMDFSPELYQAFELTVNKTGITLPADLRNQLKPYVTEFVGKAKKAYSPDSKSSADSTDKSTNSPGGNSGKGGVQKDSSVNTVNLDEAHKRNEQLGQALEKAAKKAGELQALTRIKEALKADDPIVAKEIGW